MTNAPHIIHIYEHDYIAGKHQSHLVSTSQSGDASKQLTGGGTHSNSSVKGMQYYSLYTYYCINVPTGLE